MNRRKRKAKQRAKPNWSTRRLDNWHEEFRQRQRANWSELVPTKAVATYPGSFDASFANRKVPDYALILLTLAEATKREWRYAAGNWFKDWRLTRKGRAFARDVQRRRNAHLQVRLAA